MRHHLYFVYILASTSRVLYVGVTNDLERRMAQHRIRDGGTFTGKYGVNRLVYYEAFGWIQDAIAREKQVKHWRREKKVWLIEAANPGWRDLGPHPENDERSLDA